MTLVDMSGDTFFHIFFLLSFFVLGLCLGSFSTAIIYREREGLSWFAVKGDNKRSFCPSCKHTLNCLDLVPFFSWALMKGRCRYCRAPISTFYPLIEILCAAGAVSAYLLWDMTLSLAFALVMLPFGVSMLYLVLACRRWSWRLLTVLVLILLSFLLFSSLPFIV